MTLLFQILCAFLLLCGWHFTTALGLVSPFILPPPLEVGAELWMMLVTGSYIPDLLVTLYELLVGFCIAMIAGCSVGFIVGRSAYLKNAFEPLFSSLLAVPLVLLNPLYLLIFGLGPESKIAMGATTSFFPILLSTVAGFSFVDPAYLRVSRSMGASSLQTFWWVMLPAALPVIISGLQLGLTLAVLSTLGVEVFGSYAGLGHQIVALGQDFQTARMFAYIALVFLVAGLLQVSIAKFQRFAVDRLG